MRMAKKCQSKTKPERSKIYGERVKNKKKTGGIKCQKTYIGILKKLILIFFKKVLDFFCPSDIITLLSTRDNENKQLNADWCNGSTTDSDSVCEGSSPSSVVENLRKQILNFLFTRRQVHTYRSVAQLGRALRSGRRGRVFESRHSDFKKRYFKACNMCALEYFFVWRKKLYGDENRLLPN